MRADCCSSALDIEPTGGRDDYLTGLGVGTEDVHGPSSGGASTALSPGSGSLVGSRASECKRCPKKQHRELQNEAMY